MIQTLQAPGIVFKPSLGPKHYQHKSQLIIQCVNMKQGTFPGHYLSWEELNMGQTPVTSLVNLKLIIKINLPKIR